MEISAAYLPQAIFAPADRGELPSPRVFIAAPLEIVLSFQEFAPAHEVPDRLFGVRDTRRELTHAEIARFGSVGRVAAPGRCAGKRGHEFTECFCLGEPCRLQPSECFCESWGGTHCVPRSPPK